MQHALFILYSEDDLIESRLFFAKREIARRLLLKWAAADDDDASLKSAHVLSFPTCSSRLQVTAISVSGV